MNKKICPPRVAIVFVMIACAVFLPVAVSAKDEWIQVRSKNFFLIGNADEKEIRKVATKLEQFRETFRLLFTQMRLSSPVPTNVVVFKNDSAYNPYKPKRGDGKADKWIAGYFQAGEDVNYITLAAGGDEGETFGTIYHEYVHFLLNTNFGKSDVPTWFNEGLAEYYQTYAIEKDQEVKLGLPQSGHLMLLQQSKLMPLGQLFGTSNRALHGTGGHSRSIFYAQSWALVHYLMQTGKSEGLGKFINSLAKDVPAEKAFQDAFQIGYADMEKELRKYIGKGSYQYQIFSFKYKLVFDAEMQVSALREAESNAYLGDLLYHGGRYDDAEPLLTTAVNADPNLTLANTTLGMVKMRQRKFPEAKTYLEKAVSADQKNHHALYRYAYLLSRENQDEFGFVNEFPAEKAAKMRDLLKKAIAANPSFTESHELFAFVSMVNGENLDEAVEMLKAALKHQPGNQRYALRIAEIYSRQRKFPEARAIAEKIAKTADDDEVKERADKLTEMIRRNEESYASYEQAKKQYENMVKSSMDRGTPVLRRAPRELTPEEQKKAEEEANMRSINASLRKPAPGEERVLGHIQKIDCKGSKVTFAIKTETENFILSADDFQGLSLNAFTDMPAGDVGCNGDLSATRAALTFKPAAQKGPMRGRLVAIDFIPANFRFVDPDEPPPAIVAEAEGEPVSEERIVISGTAPGGAPPADMEAMRRKAILDSIKQNLRVPAAGEKREMGFLDRSECSGKGMFFFLKVGTQVLRLSVSQSRPPDTRLYTRDLEGLQIGCGMKALEVPVIFTYTPSKDAKAKTAGELVAMEFVPKGVVLD
jgi:tetratricopeptide (TPR) repeat protein